MDVAQLRKTLAAAAETPPNDLKEEDRVALLTSCSLLKASLENPLETTLRIVMGASDAAALRLGIDMKLIDCAVSANRPVTTQELATASSADALLVARVMRMLTGMGFFEEAANTFSAKPVAAAFTTGSPLREGAIHLSSQIPTVSLLPEYFAENGYRNPSDAFHGPWQYARRTDQHYFDWLAERPVLQQAFNVVMGISRMSRGEEWFEFYPVEEKLQGAKAGPLLVDIGGGLGHDLVNLKQKIPTLAGTLMLEDLPAVVVDADLPEGIEVIGHDFFKPQPPAVRHAKAYYLRTVLHDWPDAQARDILRNIRDVMSPDSILLINENVLPSSDVSLYQAQMDLAMMACFSSLDRTEKQFEELLDSAGFRLVQVWKPKEIVSGSGTLLEAVLKS